MHKDLHHRDDADRLDVPKQDVGRGLASIQNSIDASIRLEKYIKMLGGRLISVTRNNPDNTSINKAKITSDQKCEEKQLYGFFKRQTSEISHEKT